MAHFKPRTIPLPLSASDLVRFWSYVVIGGPDDCWIWTGFKNEHGYGRINIFRGLLLSHRVAYAIHTGIDPGMYEVMHSCDNPACNNPAHLSLGTQAQNIRDAAIRARMASGDRSGARRYPRGINGNKIFLKGETNKNSKLTTEQVLAIRADTDSLRKIAAKYGIVYTHVSAIKNRHIWKHI